MAAEDDIKNIIIRVDDEGNTSSEEVSADFFDSLSALDLEAQEKQYRDELYQRLTELTDKYGEAGGDQIPDEPADHQDFANLTEAINNLTGSITYTPPGGGSSGGGSSGGGLSGGGGPAPHWPGGPPSPSPGGPGSPPPPPIPPPPGPPPAPFPQQPPIPPGPGVGALGELAEVISPFVATGVVAVAIMKELVDVAKAIDQHILSLANDIRMYSPDVMQADIYTDIRRMLVMIERAELIGPDVANYQRQRADLDAKVSRFVTQLEAQFVPLVANLLEKVNGGIESIGKTLIGLSVVIGAFSPVLGQILKIMGMAFDKIAENEFKDEDIDLLNKLRDLIGGKGAGHLGPKTAADRDALMLDFPQGKGVFF